LTGDKTVAFAGYSGGLNALRKGKVI